MQDYGINMSYQIVPDNPNMDDENPMYHYHIVLSLNGKSMQLYYSIGIWHSKLFTSSAPWEALVNSNIRDDSLRMIANTIMGKYKGSPQGFPWHLNYDKSFFHAVYDYGKRFLGKLDINDVLYCLVSDAQTMKYGFTFEEWADALGYDTDSRRAEKTYRAVKEQTEKFKGLVGKELFNQMCEDFQDY